MLGYLEILISHLMETYKIIIIERVKYVKIALLIGNGFDINLGLKTSYINFKEYLEANGEIKSLNLYRFLNEDTNNEKKLWSDLEKALGQFLSEEKWESIELDGKMPSDFVSKEKDKILDDLKDYLLSEENLIDFNEISEDIKSDVRSSFKTLISPYEMVDQNRLNQTYAFQGEILEFFPIIFNYTSTFENMIRNNTIFDIGTYSFRIKEILHPHGKLDDGMILGVNDVDHIENFEHCILNMEDLNYVLKTKTPAISSNMEYTQSMRIINDSDLIIVYGMSIGETDIFWWDLIKNRMRSNPNVHSIIFRKLPLNTPLQVHNRRDVNSRKREVKTLICRDDDIMAEIGDRIIVEFNRDVFCETGKKCEENISPKREEVKKNI